MLLLYVNLQLRLFYYISQAGWDCRDAAERPFGYLDHKLPPTLSRVRPRVCIISANHLRERRIMAEREREAHGAPEAERYHAEYVPLQGGGEGASLVALQEAINENARHSWKLISVAQDPTSQGLFLVWDTTGFFSG
jgi:hypothetical protein